MCLFVHTIDLCHSDLKLFLQCEEIYVGLRVPQTCEVMTKFSHLVITVVYKKKKPSNTIILK